MWVVKRSVLFTPVANTSTKAAIESRAMSSTRIHRQNKEFQSARVKPSVVGRGEEMPS
jgi:hypothetical protein